MSLVAVVLLCVVQQERSYQRNLAETLNVDPRLGQGFVC
jgi:hypothetical protein